MGILAVGVGRRLTGVLVRRRLMSSSSRNVTNSDEKEDVWPWLMRRPVKLKDKRAYRFYSIEEKQRMVFGEIAGELQPNSTSRIVGSSHGWLAWFNNSNLSLFLTNPVRGHHIELPSLATLPNSDNWVSRVIISDIDNDFDNESRAVMLYGPYQSMAFCVPGSSDKWSPIHNGPNNIEVLTRKYENLVYSTRRKALFCMKQVVYGQRDYPYTTTVLESWELSGSPPSPRLTWSLSPNYHPMDFDSHHYGWPDASSKEEFHLKRFGCLHFKYLVMDKASDHLFVVVRHVIPRLGPNGTFARIVYHDNYQGYNCFYPHKTIDFDVYKIDLEHNNNTMMSHLDAAASLGGLALFVGINQPFVVRPMPGSSSRLKPNSIYFTDLTEHVSWYYSGHDTGVFDYENKTFSCLPHSKSFKSMKPKKRFVQDVLSTPLPLWYTPC